MVSILKNEFISIIKLQSSMSRFVINKEFAEEDMNKILHKVKLFLKDGNLTITTKIVQLEIIDDYFKNKIKSFKYGDSSDTLSMLRKTSKWIDNELLDLKSNIVYDFGIRYGFVK
jgi:hypothetical protein